MISKCFGLWRHLCTRFATLTRKRVSKDVGPRLGWNWSVLMLQRFESIHQSSFVFPVFFWVLGRHETFLFSSSRDFLYFFGQLLRGIWTEGSFCTQAFLRNSMPPWTMTLTPTSLCTRRFYYLFLSSFTFLGPERLGLFWEPPSWPFFLLPPGIASIALGWILNTIKECLLSSSLWDMELEFHILHESSICFTSAAVMILLTAHGTWSKVACTYETYTDIHSFT